MPAANDLIARLPLPKRAECWRAHFEGALLIGPVAFVPAE
jgi:hypothetical protein